MLMWSLALVGILLLGGLDSEHATAYPCQGKGTVHNLKEIIIGRCYNYIRVINPTVGEKNCSAIWEAFQDSFIYKDPSKVIPTDYEIFIRLASHKIPRNKALFWENTKLLVHRYSDKTRRMMPLGDTLIGFLADDLDWCGQLEAPGINFQSCPTNNNAVDSFWTIASVSYAKEAEGIVTVVLNGSISNGAFPKDGYFAKYELPNWSISKISKVQIWVMDNIDGPDRESCGTGTVEELEDILRERNFNYSCIDNFRKKRCVKIWEEFLHAFSGKDPCNVGKEDYEAFLKLTDHDIPVNQSIFWSQIKDLIIKYTDVTQNYMPLERTLTGYLVDGLNWCGKSCNQELDFKSCPQWNDCENNALRSFWRAASENYAAKAHGKVTVMLNGSAIRNTFRKDSIFGEIELENLDKKVTSVHLWIIDSIDGPDKESCGVSSVEELESILKKKNIPYTCEDNYRPVQLLQCVENSDNPSCK